MTVAIVTDSTASLAPQDAQRENITVVPTTLIIGSREYVDKSEISGEELADALASFVPVSTSRPSPEAFVEAYRQLHEAGATAIVSIHLSSELSGTIDSARLAASRSEAEVYVVDSRQAGLATGFAAGRAARARDAGESVDRIVELAKDAGERSTVLLYVDTLEHLKRGGRIGPAAALIGSVLSVKPILTIADGRVEPLEKVRTSSRALARLVALAGEAVANHGGAVDIGVQHLASKSIAESVAEKIAEQIEVKTVPVDEVGADIGAHVGPGMIAVTVTPR